MPTDGTLFLENLPHSKQYLLTLLSVFFSLGAVLSSVVSYFYLPGASCFQFEGCDVEGGGNDGWKRVLFVLGIFVRRRYSLHEHSVLRRQNLVCSFMRWGLFRLHESPRYLVTNGRVQEAVVVLQAIATFNNRDVDIQPADVQAIEIAPDADRGERDKKHSELPSPSLNDHRLYAERNPLPRHSPEGDDDGTPNSRTMYDSVGLGPPPVPRQHPIRTGSAFYTIPPEEEQSNRFDASFGDAMEEDALMDGGPVKRERMEMLEAKVVGERGSLRRWKQQMGKLFVPQWRRTVVLMWIIWGAMSFCKLMISLAGHS